MLLAGKANWLLPRRLDRLLPHLNVEGGVDRDHLDAKPGRGSFRETQRLRRCNPDGCIGQMSAIPSQTDLTRSDG